MTNRIARSFFITAVAGACFLLPATAFAQSVDAAESSRIALEQKAEASEGVAVESTAPRAVSAGTDCVAVNSAEDSDVVEPAVIADIDAVGQKDNAADEASDTTIKKIDSVNEPSNAPIQETGSVVAETENDSTKVDAASSKVILEAEATEAKAKEDAQQDAVTIEAQAAQGRWEIADLGTGYGVQRYWYDGSGTLATDRLIDPSEGSGWWAYATRYGYVVRGTYDTGNGCIYIADNDGVLAGPGWVVSDAYGQGLQRYYIDPRTRSAIVGYSSDGWDHYTTEEGYVARGMVQEDDSTYLADNNGELIEDGWVVLDVNGYGLQRYWVSNHEVATDRLITEAEAGYWAYATRYGYVTRGAYDTGRGMVYLANNDGVLADANGWLVTGEYTGGILQRYYIDEETRAARSGFFTVDGYGDIFGLGGVGYVLRGKQIWEHYVILADNDGRMYTGNGWFITDAYDGHFERYYIQTCWANHFKAAKTLFFDVDNESYFGIPEQGYVVRGQYQSSYGLLIAENSGRLVTGGFISGVDLSAWQKGIDIQNLDASFVIIKATQGTDYVNPYFDTWAQDTLESGKKLGFYHFIDPTDSSRASAIAEADFFVDTVGSYIGSALLALDWEEGGNNGYFELGNTTYAKWFLDRVKQRTGVTPLIYMSKNVTSKYDWSDIASTNSLWMAQYLYSNMYSEGYITKPSTSSEGTGAWNKYPLYQYSSTATIDGYDGYLDVDVFYGGAVLWEAYAARG